MNEQPISKGDRIAQGVVAYVSPGGQVWYHEDGTGNYKCVPAADAKKGLTGFTPRAKVSLKH